MKGYFGAFVGIKGPPMGGSWGNCGLVGKARYQSSFTP